ncbi:MULTISPECIES: helix-turn-helix domain-containing protein [unclassified Aeromicrobium]|uniref:helix-turn-helix domain-containing protein n=1 Tax=unclassified Aeromicrobium TaxID=2633570 RepID=UPI00396B26F1
MDRFLLGKRLAEARNIAGQTQESVARAVDLDRTAIVALESGKRTLKVTELVAIARVLDRPLSFFVEEPIPAAVSRRSSFRDTHESSAHLDVEIEQFAGDVRTLARLGKLEPVDLPNRHTPRTVKSAEAAAGRFRQLVGLEPHEPVTNLARICEALGLYSYAAALGENGSDGGCVEVEAGAAKFGATVINGQVPTGRRRMTLAHELGHWIFGDAYDSEASPQAEKMIDAFAIHFLAPRAGVTKSWNSHPAHSERDRALIVAFDFRLSWSATIAQLRNLGVISWRAHDEWAGFTPRAGDWLRLELERVEELEAPSLSPGFLAACLDAYSDDLLTEERTLELLRGLVRRDDLPSRKPRTIEHLAGSFEGHSFSRHDA